MPFLWLTELEGELGACEVGDVRQPTVTRIYAVEPLTAFKIVRLELCFGEALCWGCYPSALLRSEYVRTQAECGGGFLVGRQTEWISNL